MAYEITWLACDLGSGRIVEELPSLATQDPLTQTLGTYATVSFDLALAGAPAEWIAATAPGRTMLVPVWDGQPQWAGIVLTRTRGSDATVPLGCVTPEAYFDRRFTGSQTYIGSDQAQIAYGLMSAALTNGPALALDAPDTGTTWSREYDDGDDTTIYSALQALMSADGGPEWTVVPQWADAGQSTVQLVAQVRPRIGVQLAQPQGVFDFPGCVTTYSQAESYEAGKGANAVQLYGLGEGASRVTSGPVAATALLAGGWPRFDYRNTPDSSQSDPGVLAAQATSDLAVIQTGASVWSLTAHTGAAPRLGTDWGIGDNVRLIVAPGQSPGHPGGADVLARAWSWQLDPAADTVTPVLVEDTADS